MSLVHPSSHPIVLRKIAALRDARSEPPAFRALVRGLAALLGAEATADLPVREVRVTTPLGPAVGHELVDAVAIVPILRAGLGMVEALLDLLPDSEVWHVGLRRDETTLRPIEYYGKLPGAPRPTVALVVDPMLATGGSAARACELLKGAGLRRIKLISLIAAPEGIARMAESMPDVPIHVGAIDERLTEIGFIYPGLGDAGDRQFATFEVP